MPLPARLLFRLLPGLALIAPASAQVLMIDFGPAAIMTGHAAISPYHAAGGGSFTDTTWNRVNTADVAADGLKWSTGTTAVGISLDLASSSSRTATTLDVAGGISGNALTSGLNQAGIYNYTDASTTSVGRDGIFTSASSGSVGLQIGGLAAGTYDLYIAARKTNVIGAYSQFIYAGTSSVAGNFSFGGYDSATLAYPSGASEYTSAWVEGQNYVRLTVTLSAGEYLNLAVQGDASTGTNLNGRGFLNSLQIVAAIPEPASAAVLLGLGSLAAVALRRRVRP